ncbi:bile acid:sodium symporter family protein [Streptomyces collinus]|uniref:bile acid:sodium symporter family protein n=1 Tax=Streptomyces collinus TaxID=42684 RepID=UPI0029422305|nr:bile acid:sodium symporter family protein [Streptomyces collinus]
MGNNSLLSGLLPIAIVVLMLGLGLALTREDFRRAVHSPRAVTVCLVCQSVVLPGVCFALAHAFGLSGPVAVGMMLVAAAPGGTTAGLFSHLAGGDVALNITLTAVNSVLAVFTLPALVGLAVAHFLPGGLGDVGLGLDELVSLWALILLPVAAGMTTRAMRPAWADRLAGPVKKLSGVFLALMAVLAVLTERSRILGQLGEAGPAATLFCVISLALGYAVPRLLGVTGAQSAAISMDIGVHNSGLALAMALGPAMAQDSAFAVPAVTYAVVALPCAGVAAFLMSRRGPGGAAHRDVPDAVLQKDGAFRDEATLRVERDG